MTQLPETELIFRDLEKELAGKRITSVWVADPTFIREPGQKDRFVSGLEGAKIDVITRIGTAIRFGLDTDQSLIVIPGARARMRRLGAKADVTETVRFTLGFSQSSLHYSDAAADGCAYLMATETLADSPLFDGLGMDPLAEPIPWPIFSAALEARKKPLLEVLIDPTFVVGIGEIYANEILFRAGLHPVRRSDSLSNQEVRRLHRSLLELISDVMKFGGLDLVVDGEPDTFLPLDELDIIEVYGRDGQPDTRSRALIERIDLEDGLVAYASRVQS